MEATSDARSGICYDERQTEPQALPNLQVRVRSNLSITGVIFFTADTLSLTVASFLAHFFWALFTGSAEHHIYHFWPAIACFWAVFWLKGLYPGVGMTPVEQFRSTVWGVSLVYLFLVASVSLAKEADSNSRGLLSLAWLFSVALVPVTRSLVCQSVSTKAWWGVPVLILGAGKTARMLIRELKTKRSTGFRPVACLDDHPSKDRNCEGVPIVGSLSSAGELARLYRIRHAIVAMPGIKRERMLVLLEQCSSIFPHVILIPDLFGISTLWVSTRDLCGMLGLEMRFNLLIPFNRWLKRTMDLIISIIALFSVIPVIAVCAVLIKLVNPGPAFYFQDREGLSGKTIRIPKLRTMHTNGDEILSDYLRSNPSAQNEWNRHCKLKHDPRILPFIGRFLRRTSIDELPQLWNVIRGEMSLVGPRPFPKYHIEKFTGDFSALRRRVIPGLTGLWQISARSDGDIEDQMQLDTYYIRNWSVWLDIYILCRTARAVISGNGAY